MSNLQGNDTNANRIIREEKQREHAREYTDPEKHYVRKNVWQPAAIDRLQKLRVREQRRLKYFTLCAEKAIDIHYFGISNLIEDRDGLGYPSVAFCECFPDQYEMIAANLGRTRGFLSRFEDLVLDRESEVSKSFYSELPFDIYNLDFTGVCFPSGDSPFSNTLNAIVALIEELGTEKYHRGFEMFFTFRAKRSEENEEAITQLKDNLRDNRDHYGWYNHAFEEKYGDIGRLLKTRYHEFLLCALPKLIGQFGRRSGFQVACPYRLFYPRPNIKKPNYYIISFVLSFDWIGPNKDGRRAVRQVISRQEIATSAYLDLIRVTVERDVQNVSSTPFPREDYKREVADLLEAVENP
jgi:hypothetical protein